MDRKKVLFILSRFPFPLIKGDKLRAYYQIRELSKTCDVYLFALSDQRVSPADREALEPYCAGIKIFRLRWIEVLSSLIFHFLFSFKPVQVGYFYNSRTRKKMLKELRSLKVDHVFCQLIRTSEYGKYIDNIPKTLDYMDALSAGMQRRYESTSVFFRWIIGIEAKRLKRYEHHIYKSFSCATVISPSDRDLIFHYANEDIIVLPNGIDHEFFKPKQVEKEFELLFTGNMSYPPNVQSARFLVEYIMPLIWRELPKCKLLISGANPSKAVKKLAGEGVVVRPYIKDIRDSYNSSQVFIAPMFIGSGMQNKLLEAMAMNLPCITSELANRALNARENEELLIGKSYADYADKAVELLKNRKLANEIAQKGHSFVRNQFDWSTSNEILLNIINGKIPRS